MFYFPGSGAMEQHVERCFRCHRGASKSILIQCSQCINYFHGACNTDSSTLCGSCFYVDIIPCKKDDYVDMEVHTAEKQGNIRILETLILDREIGEIHTVEGMEGHSMFSFLVSCQPQKIHVVNWDGRVLASLEDHLQSIQEFDQTEKIYRHDTGEITQCSFHEMKMMKYLRLASVDPSLSQLIYLDYCCTWWGNKHVYLPIDIYWAMGCFRQTTQFPCYLGITFSLRGMRQDGTEPNYSAWVAMYASKFDLEARLIHDFNYSKMCFQVYKIN